MIESHALRLFVAVGDHLHFGRAAQALGMSQPPLSQQIRRLEERIGAPLFHRSRRSVELTALGRSLLPEARAVLEQLAAIERRCVHAAAGDVAHLELGYIGPALERLAPVLRRLREDAPEVSVGIRRCSTIEQLRLIRAGVLQAGVTRLYEHDVRGLSVEVVWREPYVLAVPEKDPLSSRARVRLKSCADREFLFFPRVTAPALNDALLERFSSHGFRPRIRAEFGDKREIVAMAAAGFGIGLVPMSFTRGAPEGVRFVGIVDKLPAVAVSLVSLESPPPGMAQLRRAWLDETGFRGS